MKIYLIGMPGSGKTTLGKQVASELQLEFVDLDQAIELREQKSIFEIFSQSGEDHFRKVESAVLHELAASVRSFVMATGGGAPCFFGGIDVINDTGISIFLDQSLDELVKRSAKETHRPLLQAQDADQLRHKLESLLNTRLPVYRKAQFALRNPTVKTILEKVSFRK